MRSKEFIVEAPPRYDDPFAPEPGSVAAAQADAARIAQGQKNLNALKGFFGGKPEELKDSPPGTSIDPFQRSRLGYKPATQKEIADFQAANPNYGKVVDRNGNPIKTGDGSDLVAGGEKGVVQTAQAAAPQSKGDAFAGQGGYNYQSAPVYDYDTPAEPNKMPAPRQRADRRADLGADAAADAAKAAAAADQGRKAIGSTESPVQSTTPAVEPRKWDPRVYGAAHAGQGGTVPDIIRPNAMAAPGEPPVADVDVYKRSEMDDFGREGNRRRAEPTVKQNATPKAGFKMSPTVWEYAINMGLIQNGKPVDAAIKAFQEKNGLTKDGVIGPNTSNAILSAAKPGMPNIGRGQQGGATGTEMYKPVQPATPKSAPAKPESPQVQPGQGATPTVTPPKPVIGAPMPNGRRASQTDVLSWENQYGPAAQAAKQKDAASTAAAAAAKQAYNPYVQNKVQEDISRMRFLAGLSKD